MSRDELPYCGECGMSHNGANEDCKRGEELKELAQEESIARHEAIVMRVLHTQEMATLGDPVALAAVAAAGVCPNCRSDQIEGGHVTVESGECFQRVSCAVCGGSWCEVYLLVRVEDFQKQIGMEGF